MIRSVVSISAIAMVACATRAIADNPSAPPDSIARFAADRAFQDWAAALKQAKRVTVIHTHIDSSGPHLHRSSALRGPWVEQILSVIGLGHRAPDAEACRTACASVISTDDI